MDEYTLCQTLGYDAASSVLQEHWSTWITEADFFAIATAGMNHVRIPIGYWSVSPISGEPYVQGAYPYLGAALDWAQAAGLKVLIDLHGGESASPKANTSVSHSPLIAPGSQNGFDNSGRRGAIDWTQGETITQTHAALNQIRDDHAAHPACAAIELVNEPLGPDLDRMTIEQFYYDGWGDLYNDNVAVTFHDAFYGDTTWNDFGNNLPNWLLDTHHYEVFDSGSLALSPPAHIAAACAFGAGMATNNKVTIAGEWTGAMTDCAKWLNGLGVGARYDGTFDYEGQSSSYIGSCTGLYQGTVAGMDPTYRTNVARFIEAQMDAFEEAGGWIFWTWKTEGAPEWDMQALLQAGVINTPVTGRTCETNHATDISGVVLTLRNRPQPVRVTDASSGRDGCRRCLESSL